MANLKKILKIVLKNKIILFLFSRYGTYFIHFVNSLFIAVYLGPYYLGIWGFISLTTQYLNHINFGVVHAVTAIISVHKKKEIYVQKIIGASITLLIALSIIIVLFFGTNALLGFDIGAKYNFSTYVPIVVLIGTIGHFNSLFSTIFRVYGRLFEIAVNQTVFPVFLLIAIILFRGKDLLWALVIAHASAFLVSFLVYIVKSPVALKPILSYPLFKVIQVKGWHLFIYNTSFFFIVIATRSFVSAFYPIEEFGYFTFAFSLANVILLLLQAFSFVIFPKILNRFANATNDENVKLLSMVRDAYVCTSHLLIHIAILLFPFFLLLFPQYEIAGDAFKLIALSIVLYTNSFGYSGLLIAKGKEKSLGVLAFSVLSLNVLLGLFLVKILHVPFTMVILATMFSYFVYVLAQGIMGRKMLQLKTSIKPLFKDVYPIRLVLPHLLSLGFVLGNAPNYYFILVLVLFLVFNYKVLFKLKGVAKSILHNPNFINI